MKYFFRKRLTCIKKFDTIKGWSWHFSKVKWWCSEVEGSGITEFG